MNGYRLLTCLAAATVVAIPATAMAQGGVPSLNTPPSGPGTEARPATPRHGEHLVEGVQAGGQLGAGFTDTYGFGLGARIGYTFLHGVYVGGAITHYFGNSVDTVTGTESAHATFFGGEAGYSLYPDVHWELRPYVFLGPSWITTVQSGTGFKESRTRLAFQPGVLVAYHFGNVFLTGEGKFHVTPDPTAFTLLAGAGVGFR
jgi:hypothetical protein